MNQSPYPIQVDHDFKRKWNRYSLWAGVTTVAGLIATMVDLFQAGRFGLTGWIGFGTFALGILLMNIKYRRALRGYTCPVCLEPCDTPKHRKLEHNRKQTAVFFDCDQCMISWDTTLREDEAT